ncbi:MAG: hypothetical protein OEO83_11935 [Alphaproteobacteria bacterium]|nr:hypothetical protein [Alphaproteobacteria bacterium]
MTGYLGTGEGASLAFFNTLLALRRPGLTMRYYLTFGRFPNYLSPKGQSEKIQWRKLFDRNPLFAVMCDKLAARDHAAQCVPQLRFPKLHWSGTDPDRIPLETIPLPYVIKPNNRSGEHIFVLRPEEFDKPAILRRCRAWMAAKPFGGNIGEWGYGQVPTRIQVEAFLSAGEDLAPPANYEFFVYHGRVGAIYYSVPPLGGRPRKRGLFTTDWQAIAADRWRMKGFDPFDADIPKPDNLTALVEAAEKIAAELDFARVDLFNLDGAIYLSEVTLYPSSGFSIWVPKDAAPSARPPRDLDERFGALWTLPSLPFWTCVRRGLFGG